MAASFKGKLLVAHPHLEDPNFYRTVVLLFEHNEEGAFGTVLNRPTEEPAGDYVTEWAHLMADPGVVFIGGPVQNEIAVGVAEWDTPGDFADITLFSGVGFVNLSEPPEPTSSPVRVRVFSGYSGWDAGQLEVEMAIDSWFIADPVVDDVFGDPEGLWSRVLRRQEGLLSLYAQYPRDVSLN